MQRIFPGAGRRKIFAAAAIVLASAALLLGPVFAQRQYSERQLLLRDLAMNRRPPEGTEFIFARVEFNSGYGGYGPFAGGWWHDYPVGEEHILAVAHEATMMNVTDKSYVIVRLDSDEIFQYPFLYFSEVGDMVLTDQEVRNFREYLNRGGFAMVDDFDNIELLNWFQDQMRRVFPDRNFVKLSVDNPIFHTFYDIPTLNMEPPAKGRRRPGERPTFYGYYDDQGRLCMIINHNNDLGDFWEWIDQPMYPLQPSTEALRFGVDYLIYSMTH